MMQQEDIYFFKSIGCLPCPQAYTQQKDHFLADGRLPLIYQLLNIPLTGPHLLPASNPLSTLVPI